MVFCFTGQALASYSSIVEASGMSCDDSVNEAELVQLALTDARRNASEAVQTKIDSYSKAENYAVVKDLIESYSHAEVKTLDVLSKQKQDGCLRVSIRAEVTPEVNLDKKFVSEELLADPTIPLTVKLWVDKNDYKIGDHMVIYVKANKPFYGRLIYTMNDGTTLQLLPNPYRSANHFLGQVLYTVPTAEDAFRLEVSAPIGMEKLTLFASTYPLGDIKKTDVGGMYLVDPQVAENEVKSRTRGLKIKALNQPAAPSSTPAKLSADIAEFSEVTLDVVIKE